MLALCEGLTTVALDAYARPPENPPDKVEKELRRLVQCTPETEQDVYSGVLCAVGNNDAGSYYPIVVPVIPLLGEILKDGSTTARETTLNVLIDLVSSFGPEPGFETIETSDGPRRSRTWFGRKSCAWSRSCKRLPRPRAPHSASASWRKS